MRKDLHSPRSEVLLLLDLVATEPEAVSKRAWALLHGAKETSSDNSEILALTQRCYGLALRGCGNTYEALVWLQTAVDSAAESGLVSVAASSRLALASTQAMAGEFDAALRSAEAALPKLPSNEVAAALSRRAIFLQRLERTNEAVFAYDQAVERAVSDNQELELAKTLNNRGLFRVDLGDMEGASSDLLKSSKQFLDLGLVNTSSMIDHNLGWCFARQGLVVEALAAYDRSDAKGGLGNSATWEGAFDRAEVYVSARLLPEALHSATHSLRLAREAGFESEVPVISLLLGRIQAALGEIGSAKESFGTAESRFREQGRNSSADGAFACSLLLSEQPRHEELKNTPSFVGDDDGLLVHRDTLVDVAYGELFRSWLRGRPLEENKRLSLERILESGFESTNSLTRLQAYAARIVMLCDRKMPGVAFRNEVEEAVGQLLEELGRHLIGIHSQELRTVVVDKLELEALVCAAALSIGEPEIFRLWISRLRAAISTPARSTSMEAVKLNSLRQSDKGPQRNALEFAVRSTHWTSSATPAVTSFSTETLRPSPAPANGEVVLMYAQNATNLVLSVITEHAETIEVLGLLKDIRTRSESVSLGAAGLFGSGTSGGTERGEKQAVSLIRAIDRLEALVLPASLPAGNLSISITGALGSVPWNLFSRLAGRAVVLSSSLGPIHPTDAFERAKSTANRIGIVEGPELEHGTSEVDAVAELYDDPIVLRGSQATVEAVGNLLTTADLVHVAAHGRRRVDNALFSGIELYDGPLMAYDIERLSQTPGTVILSCCDLGAANSQGAFGLLGFSGAMVSRGSHRVAAAVFPVSDEVSRFVMVGLHKAMKQGLSVAQAVTSGVTNASSLFERVTAGSYVVKGP
jgi:tetratricopeptide (TPR) repeat protein